MKQKQNSRFPSEANASLNEETVKEKSPSDTSENLKKKKKERVPMPARHRKGSIILLRGLIAVLIALAVFFVSWLLLLIVSIEEIVIPEGSFYTYEEICEAADLRVGGRMYLRSSAQIRDTLMEKLPMLDDVRIDRDLRGVLRITPVETEYDFYIKVSGNYYLLSRRDYKVLYECEEPSRLTERGCYEISLPEVRVAFLGKPLEFGKEGNNGYVNMLIRTLEGSFLKGRVTGIRAAEQFNVSIIVDGKYNVLLGSVTDIQKKLNYLERMMKSDVSEVFTSGSDAEVNLTDLSAPTARMVEKINTAISE